MSKKKRGYVPIEIVTIVGHDIRTQLKDRSQTGRRWIRGIESADRRWLERGGGELEDWVYGY